jgi:DNA-binding MarR family transcriptional regulator
MPESPSPPSRSASIRVLVHRKVLAAYRQRTAVARRLAISESELGALSHLAEGALTPGELGRRLQLTSGGMTALLHRLHKAGHIARRPHPTDRRSVVVSANPQILERITELVAPLAADVDRLAAELSPDEHEVVHGFLEQLATVSERRADELVTDVEAAEALPAEDAMHLWA